MSNVYYVLSCYAFSNKQSVAAAQGCYAQSDYFEGQEIVGKLGDKVAIMLGVDKASFDLLCENKNHRFGNNVAMNLGNGLQRVGKLTDSNTLFIDAGMDYWLFESGYDQGSTGVIRTFEIHQKSALQDGD